MARKSALTPRHSPVRSKRASKTGDATTLMGDSIEICYSFRPTLLDHIRLYRVDSARVVKDRRGYHTGFVWRFGVHFGFSGRSESSAKLRQLG